MKRILVLGSIALSSMTMAQNDIKGGPVNILPNGVTDGVYVTEHIPTKRMIPYEFVREADDIWSKRVWRVIDMREKINHTIYLPFDEHTPSGQYIRNTSRWSLWTILRHHIFLGEINMYSAFNPLQQTAKDGDQFKYPILPEAGKNYYNDSIFRTQMFEYFGRLIGSATNPRSNVYGEDSIIYDADGVGTIQYFPQDTSWLDSKDVVQYKIKEDWFFDKERSVLDVRILGIAPVIYNITDDGTNKKIEGTKEVFWLYFPHIRYILNNYFVFNEKNDAQWMSFDDLFWKRRFSSTIYKESNVFERNIDAYRTGVDALMESEKVTEEIRLFEHDVWNF